MELSIYLTIKLTNINCRLAVVGSTSISLKEILWNLTVSINFDNLFKSVLTDTLSVLISSIPLKALCNCKALNLSWISPTPKPLFWISDAKIDSSEDTSKLLHILESLKILSAKVLVLMTDFL